MTNLGRLGGGNAEIKAAVAVEVATIVRSLMDSLVFSPNNAFIPENMRNHERQNRKSIVLGFSNHGI